MPRFCLEQFNPAVGLAIEAIGDYRLARKGNSMARVNILNLSNLAPAVRALIPRTHEGAPARNISFELQLRRSVLACMLWESQFYEDGAEIAARIAELVPKVAPEKVAALAVEA